MDVMVGHDPAGTSLWNTKHWRDNMLKGGFRKFDYGNKNENIFHYG